MIKINIEDVSSALFNRWLDEQEYMNPFSKAEIKEAQDAARDNAETIGDTGNHAPNGE